jgi:hypothetical protein
MTVLQEVVMRLIGATGPTAKLPQLRQINKPKVNK